MGYRDPIGDAIAALPVAALIVATILLFRVAGCVLTDMDNKKGRVDTTPHRPQTTHHRGSLPSAW